MQYIHSGYERIDIALVNTMQLGEYIVERDFQAMTGKGNPLILPAASFAVFFPQDAHKPLLAVAEPVKVKKVVIKCEIAT